MVTVRRPNLKAGDFLAKNMYGIGCFSHSCLSHSNGGGQCWQEYSAMMYYWKTSIFVNYLISLKGLSKSHYTTQEILKKI